MLNNADKTQLAAEMLFPTHRKANRVNYWAYANSQKFAEFYFQACESEKVYLEAKAKKRYVIEPPLEGYLEISARSSIPSGITTFMVHTTELKRIFQPPISELHAEADKASLRGQAVGAAYLYLYHLQRRPQFKMIIKNMDTARMVCHQRSIDLKTSILIEDHAEEINRFFEQVPASQDVPSQDNGEEIRKRFSMTSPSQKKWWPEYEPVAHWWAAYVSLNNVFLEPTRAPLSDKLNLEEFFRRAKYFARIGTQNYGSGPDKSPPLDPSILYWPGSFIWNDGVTLDLNDQEMIDSEICQQIDRAIEAEKRTDG